MRKERRTQNWSKRLVARHSVLIEWAENEEDIGSENIEIERQREREKGREKEREKVEKKNGLVKERKFRER